MNLAYRDIKHNLLRFVLTNFGLSLLLGVVIVITGVYGGLVDDALRQARAANADLWVVQAGTNGPFAESSRIPGDTRELVARVYGVQRAGSVTYQSVQTALNGNPLRLYLIGYELGHVRNLGPRRWRLAEGHRTLLDDPAGSVAAGDAVEHLVDLRCVRRRRFEPDVEFAHHLIAVGGRPALEACTRQASGNVHAVELEAGRRCEHAHGADDGEAHRHERKDDGEAGGDPSQVKR